MKCPYCKTSSLRRDLLDASLTCRSCSECGGTYIRLQDYLTWKASGVDLEASGDLELTARDNDRDNDRALLCPETGRMMLKYDISKDTTHRVDYSRFANAVWLDAGEWALLKEQGLTGHLHEIFTEPYQTALRAVKTKESLDEMYRRKFGDAAYDDLKRMRSWLMSQGQRSDMLGFLMAQDPYAVQTH